MGFNSAFEELII